MTYNTIDNDVTMPGNERALLANRYRIIKQLGQGGMGSVWLAEDMQLDNKQFAIKMLPSILVSNSRAYRQLKDEALVAMKLVHPNIVQLRAFEENNGNPFLVMDYIDGRTLDDYLAEKGKLSEDEAIKLLKPIAAALDYAHGEGVVHRDVKPANVMIRKDGRPIVLDFGIAREIQETMTRVTGKLSSGTLLYMSPEQLHGAAPKKEQDIYSFAAMAYECIKGAPPFTHGAIEDQIKNEPPAPLPEGACTASIMSGLAKNPEDRPATCVGVLSGGVLTQSRRDAERQSVDSSRAERVEKTEGGARNGGLGKVFGVLGLIIGAFGLGALISPAKADDQSGAQPPTVRQPDSKPVTREDASPKDGDTKTMTLPGGVKMEMVYVAPGTFKMGSYGEDNEKPVHDVRITKGYWIGKYPVTQSQWKALASANGVSFAKGEPVPYFSTSGEGRDSVAGLDTSDFPMENISWDDCDKFVKALNRREGGGRTWSMPTEAQWEFAARGGNKSHGYTYSGGNDMDALGWYYENSGVGRLSDSDWKYDNLASNKCRTHSVKEKDVGNELGIVGMSGNVSEWCQDWYNEDYYSKSQIDDPCNTASGDFRVLRGGCWSNLARSCRSASRIRNLSWSHGSIYGFRLCCSAQP